MKMAGRCCAAICRPVPRVGFDGGRRTPKGRICPERGAVSAAVTLGGAESAGLADEAEGGQLDAAAAVGAGVAQLPGQLAVLGSQVEDAGHALGRDDDAEAD